MIAVPKNVQLRDQRYLDYLKTQPCLLTGSRGRTDPAHIGTAGKALKIGDDQAIPLDHSLHLKGHNGGEVSMLREYAPDWLIRDAFRAYAQKLYQQWVAAGRPKK